MSYEPEKEVIKKLLNSFYKKNYIELIKKISNLLTKYPKSIFLLNLLGATHNELNNFDKAIHYFNEIIKLNKNFADAYYNLGIIYKKIDKIEESINNYTACININPDKFEAYNNLGNIHRDNNDIEKAIKNYLLCLEVKSDYLVALQNFGICLQTYYLNKRSDAVDRHLNNLLKQDKIIRPVDIINSLINYLYLNPEFSELIDKIEDLDKKLSIEELCNKLLSIKIFISLLKITPITDLKIEKIIKFLRKKILLNINSVKNSKVVLEISKAIAMQCFINEYLYLAETIEIKKLKEIENTVSNSLNEKKYNDHNLEISCLATYKSLNFYKWSNKIINSDEISDLFNQQIKEPNIEISLESKIISKDIIDTLSIKVKNQYENNPYPRWTKIALNSKPDDILNYTNNRRLIIEQKKINNWKKINVLVAGCGTGQHAITTATKYKNSFVTAIDLSLKSLCYAKRKADELGIKNIEFIEMDILDLKNYDKTFEIIESIGVLHHMKDPVYGWRTLTNILKPNGLIMIGLYSEKAREHIKRIRLNIKETNKKINNENIKLFREKIISSNDEDSKLIKQSPDFYSLSSLRDLLFHVQEHTFSLTRIIDIINKLDLKFCGFENKEVISFFKKTYKNKDDLYNLDIWNKFENSNKRTFAGMYQFWCQKI